MSTDCLNKYDNCAINTNSASLKHSDEISLKPEDLYIFISFTKSNTWQRNGRTVLRGLLHLYF